VIELMANDLKEWTSLLSCEPSLMAVNFVLLLFFCFVLFCYVFVFELIPAYFVSFNFGKFNFTHFSRNYIAASKSSIANRSIFFLIFANCPNLT